MTPPEEQVVVEFTEAEAEALWQATHMVPVGNHGPAQPDRPIFTARNRLMRALRDREARVRLRSIREDEA